MYNRMSIVHVLIYNFQWYSNILLVYYFGLIPQVTIQRVIYHEKRLS